ncbi:MAG: restriction endonuclease subunit S [Bacteroidetes bacterium]|nr:restriction endonuclease subunit S [Bacteroidota bacterium]
MDIKALLKVLGFSLEEGKDGVWLKSFANHSNYKIKVDLTSETIDYGKQITVVGKTTSNFKAAENLVVLECVNRLLEKGYKPKNIHLEKTWATGHGTSGRLDILVTHDNGTAYLMIECKTYGAEFDKEFKKVLKDGGQLFTYFQQDKNADILMLYASHLDKGKLIYRNEIVKIEEDYRQTGNVKDFYDRWNKLPKNNGVFDSWVKAYDFQSKALTPKNLKDIKQEDSSFIFNQFLEILRHNVVSDKPNAFNKIFTLFLCKIYDEKVTKPTNELAFQWFYTPYEYEGISYPPDDNISFQKRLTDLYKKGMKEFLDKSVTDISDADFEKKYGKLDAVTKKQILDEFTEIRLKKNNEFAIKEVFNDDSFIENAKVVKEVVELLQGYKIRYTKKQQYLSDFFELLLTTGLKQESGQFFTPVPIAQFIIKSIPLDKIVADKLEKGEKDNLLPTIIDYAAGSGHFITESMHEVQRIIDKTNPDDFVDGTGKKISSWKTDHFDWAFQYIYGIEKDYRLVKVGKVGCYLHGDGLAQIVHSDGLGNFSKTEEYKGLLRKFDKDFPKENKQFDIVVSNPPYSVSAFKNNARKFYTEDDFEIYEKLTDQSSEIECLFIERTKQLLKDGGIAGIILPSSILSNTGIYTKAREIILQYFDIVGIAELGGNTFMATNTSTVTLFLRRRNNYFSVNIRALVKKSLADFKDVTINAIEKPLSKYVDHVWQGITYKDYVTLLQQQPNDLVKQHEIYKEYSKKIKAKSDTEFWNAVLELEEEKVFYFVLAYPQKVVLINSGEKNDEKDFLGYEFSNRRGSEGIHPIQRGKSIDECTKLFDPEVFENSEKASTYIYKAFQGDFFSKIHPTLEKNISRLQLVDMLTYDRIEFEKNISLIGKKKVKLESKWPQTKLEDVSVLLLRGKSAKYGNSKIQVIKSGQARGYKEFNFSEKYYTDANYQLDERQLKKGDVLINSSGVGTAGRVTLFELDGTFVTDSHITLLRADKLKIIPDYILQCLACIGFKNIEAMAMGQSGQIELSLTTIQNIKIPLPPLKVQEKISSEISKVDLKIDTLKKSLKELKSKKDEIIQRYFNSNKEIKRLSEIADFKRGPFGGSLKKEIFTDSGYKVYEQKHAIANDFTVGRYFISEEKFAEMKTFELLPGDLIMSCSGTIGKIAVFPSTAQKGIINQALLRFRPKSKITTSKYLKVCLSYITDKFEENSHGSGLKNVASVEILKDIKVYAPSIEEQEKIISQIEKLENEIEKLENEVLNIPAERESILLKYL